MSSHTKTLKLSAKQRQFLSKSLAKPKDDADISKEQPTPHRSTPSGRPAPETTTNGSLKRKREGADDKPAQKQAQPAKDVTPTTHGDLPGRLRAAQFRYINEMLYTTTSHEAVIKTAENPGLLVAYHEGFRHQVNQWPVNPVDVFINELGSMLVKKKTEAGSGDAKTKRLRVADLGCGEAKIAQSFKDDKRIKVHSLDLTAVNSFVTACDIAKTPLDDSSVDVAIFCLSLMGTNYLDFVKEAVRILRPSGVVKIAEVKSRISDTSQFVKAIESCGLKLQHKDSNNKMFELFNFVKVDKVQGAKGKEESSFALRPCLYKKR